MEFSFITPSIITRHSHLKNFPVGITRKLYKQSTHSKTLSCHPEHVTVENNARNTPAFPEASVYWSEVCLCRTNALPYKVKTLSETASAEINYSVMV